MRFSVIIPGFGRGRAAAEAQAERLRGLIPDSEMIVADGHNVASARNNGLAAARGDWIVWVDADDEVSEDWARVICEAADGDADVVLWNYEYIGTSLHYVSRWRERHQTAENLLRAVLDDGEIGSHLWRMAIRRTLWCGVRFDDALDRLEDYQLLPHVISRAKKVKYEDRTLYRYLQSETSVSRTQTLEEINAAERTAWRRYEEWRDTMFADDALLGAARVAYNELQKRILAGIPVDGDAGARESRRCIAENWWRLVKCRGCDWRIAVKFFIVISGWWWIQKFSWRLRKVRGLVQYPVP